MTPGLSSAEHARRRNAVLAGRAAHAGTRQIAADLGIGWSTLKSWMRLHARDLIQAPTRGRASVDTSGWQTTVERLVGEGWQWQEIAAHLGVSDTTLRRWRVEHMPETVLRCLARPGRPDPPQPPAPVTAVAATTPGGCRVVVWREWPGVGVLRRVLLTEGSDSDGAVWSVDCVTCHRAWVATSEDHAHQLRDLHLADRTAPSATTRREAS